MSYLKNNMSGWLKLFIIILVLAVIVLTLVVIANKVPAVNTFFVDVWNWIKDLFTGKLFKKK